MIELKNSRKSNFYMKKRKIVKNRRVHKKLKIKNRKFKSIKKIKNNKRFKNKIHIKKIKKIFPVIVDIPISSNKNIIKKRRGRTPSNKMYFTKDTENSIIEYNNTSNLSDRETIYNTKIKYPFEKLVENIFNTFKFSYFETSPLDVQKETVSHLVSNIHKFEAGKGKAFSYFSIIAKHYLIALNNTTYKRRNQHVEIGEDHDENTIQLQMEDKHHKETEMKEFMNLMILFWENNIGKIFTKQRDLNIANAVVELFRASDRIDSFNKKALYLYIREISNCRTQQITKVINRMKQYQTIISKSYLNQGIVNIKNYLKV